MKTYKTKNKRKFQWKKQRKLKKIKKRESIISKTNTKRAKKISEIKIETIVKKIRNLEILCLMMKQKVANKMKMIMKLKLVMNKSDVKLFLY